jgi:DNA-binding Lrp family transcriptional regulator
MNGGDLDDLDRAILDALLADGRATIRDVATEVGAATATVTQRLDAIEQQGVVEGYVPRLDYAELGFPLTAVFHLSVDGEGIADVVERLGDHDRMIDVYEVTGSHDVVAVGKFADVQSMNAQIVDLVTDPQVTGVSTNVVRDIVREHEVFRIDAAGDG